MNLFILTSPNKKAAALPRDDATLDRWASYAAIISVETMAQ